MNVQRALCAAALSAGIALTGFLGAGVANAKETPTPQPVPGPTLSHHDQKKLDKYLKKHPEIAVPNTGAH